MSSTLDPTGAQTGSSAVPLQPGSPTPAGDLQRSGSPVIADGALGLLDRLTPLIPADAPIRIGAAAT